MNDMFSDTFFGPHPWGLGAKKSNVIKVITKSIPKIFKPILCVFSQMKDIKHIRRDFHLATWVMPQGWDLGVLGVKKYFQNMIMLHIKLKGMISRPP